MSLADELYEANAPGADHEEDELGLAIWDNVEYVVARALMIASKERKDQFTIDQPHMRGDQIWFGNKPLKEDYKNLVKLTRFTKRISPAKQIMFWETLKKYLPRLNKSIIQVSDNIFYDVEEGELIDKEELANRANI